MVSIPIILVTYFVSLFVLLALGMWMAVGIGVVGAGNAIIFIRSGQHLILNLTFNALHSYILSAVPVFILMGEIIFQAGLSDRLYTGLQGTVSRLPGGLLHVNVIASAIFAAACGSSLAEVSALVPVALPALEKRGYNKKWSMGSIAAAGSLGILIPPSVAMILYGFLTDTSIGKLFIAGIIPGIILALMFSLLILAQTLRNPGSIGGIVEKTSFVTGIKNLVGVIPVVLLIITILGSIYMGIATPTEAAGVGVIGALVIAAGYRRLTWRMIFTSIKHTLVMWGMVGLIVVAAVTMSTTLSYLDVGTRLSMAIASLPVPGLAILFILYLVYIALGCVMSGLALLVVTLPVIFPIIIQLGYDPLWFGVALVILLEMAGLTPPVGAILWVLQGYTGESMKTITEAILPFFYIQILFLIILTFVPQLATWLPGFM